MVSRILSFNRCLFGSCLGACLLVAACVPVVPPNTPVITPTCISPAPEANPYTAHEITAGVQKIYQKTTTDLGNARQEALFQLGQNMAHWSDHVDIVNDNSHMVRITVTYLDPVLVQYIVLNHFINQPDYLASLATPMHEVTFNFELSNTLQNLGKRAEMLFIVTITSPLYRRQVYNSTDLILQFPIEKLKLSSASNMQVEPIHFDRILAQDMDITQGPVSGIVGFPLALEIDDLCNVVIDQWTNTLTLDVSSATLGGIEYANKFWSIPYRSLVKQSDTHPTPTSNPYILNNQITKLNEPPTPSWTPSPGYDDAVSQVYWENMGQYIWDLVITESNH